MELTIVHSASGTTPRTDYAMLCGRHVERRPADGLLWRRELRTYHDSRYAAFFTLIRSTFDEAAQHFAHASIDLLRIDGYHTYKAADSSSSARPQRPLPR